MYSQPLISGTLISQSSSYHHYTYGLFPSFYLHFNYHFKLLISHVNILVPENKLEISVGWNEFLLSEISRVDFIFYCVHRVSSGYWKSRCLKFGMQHSLPIGPS